MAPTYKNVTPYNPTSLNIRAMVNAPLCNCLYICFYTFYAIPTSLLILVSVIYGVQAAHAKLQPQDIHSGIGPYFCNPKTCQLAPFCTTASPLERAEK